ncbi:MAG TPA: hypothetical protein VLS27_04495 [Gammaproteobacteria bacterium]|nr:hypothetical protein [Gammaproteobacteria bacterium]
MTQRSIAGALIAMMLVASIANGLVAAVPEWIPGLAAWTAAALLWAELSSGQMRQCLVLVAVGLSGVVVGRLTGVAVDYARLLHENQSILALIAGVSFVHMATPRGSAHDRVAPRGAQAFLRTLLGLNLLAAAINITALMLVSDRVSRSRPLGRVEASAFSRTFSLAVLYSPFIGGMALALNQAPEASLSAVAPIGVILAVVGIGFTYLVAKKRYSESLAGFTGYPLRLDVLWLPAALAVAVVALRLLWPNVPVLTATALLAPLIACIGVARRAGLGQAGAGVVSHARVRLPGMAGELALFLSAGVLAVGLSSAFAASGITLPETRFPGAGATVALLVVVLVAAAGLHPIISLTAMVPLLDPLGLSPEGTVMLYVAGWSIGCALCPFSGTNLILQARHGIPAWRFPQWSAGYGLFMWLLASAALILESALR